MYKLYVNIITHIYYYHFIMIYKKEKIYKIISFLKFLVNTLCGNTMEFKRIFSDAKVTLVPEIMSN